MRNNQGIFGGLRAWFGFGKARRKKRTAAVKAKRSLLIEDLEKRTLLSVATSTWIGGHGNNWSTAANWLAGSAPINNAALIFSGANTATNNDMSGMSFASIEFSSPNFTLAGNSITLANGVTVDSGINNSTISLAIGLGGSVSFNIAGSGLSDSGVLSGTGSLTKSGAGTLTVSGNNTYCSGTQVDNGTLLVQNYCLPSGGIAIASGATLDYNTAAGTINQQPATFTGGGTLQVDGGNSPVLGGARGYVNVNLSAGASIDVVAGTLVGSADYNGQWAGNNASLNIAAGATFDGEDANVRINALTGSGTFEGGWGNGSTDTIGDAGGSGTFSGAVQNGPDGILSLVKAGGGRQVLSGDDTFSGNVTVSAGTLVDGGVNALGAQSTMTMIDGGGAVSISLGQAGPWTVPGNFTLNGGQISSTGSNTTLSGTITAIAPSTLDVPSADKLSITGAVTGQSNLAQAGGGTVSITGDADIASSGTTGSVANSTTGSAANSGTTGTVAASGSATSLAQPLTQAAPTFTLTSPASGSFVAGTTITVQWTDANVPATGYTSISLAYDTTTNWGNPTWIEI
ncbi:MAG: beta strand repeat-containing protein, partial [Thermoguttaceae bacterium]